MPPSRLELMNTDSSISLNSGGVRQLSCRARDARPQAKIVWYQGDHKIDDLGELNHIYLKLESLYFFTIYIFFQFTYLLAYNENSCFIQKYFY